MNDRNAIIEKILTRVRDGLDNLTTIGEDEADDRYNEAVYDAVHLIDEMIHNFEASPEDFIEELAIDVEDE
jgi:hypothetical protein